MKQRMYEIANGIRLPDAAIDRVRIALFQHKPLFLRVMANSFVELEFTASDPDEYDRIYMQFAAGVEIVRIPTEITHVMWMRCLSNDYLGGKCVYVSVVGFVEPEPQEHPRYYGPPGP